MSSNQLIRRLAIVAAVAASVTLSAQSLTIKMGTVVPKQSPWVDTLLTMGQTWEKATGSRVRLTIFGSLPSDTSIVNRMGTGGLEGGALSISGLAEIDESINALGIPFFFESDAEFSHVLEKLTPMLKARLAAKKFQLLLWGHAGWIQVFSKKPIRTFADLQRASLWTSDGDPKMVQWYNANGFHPVPRPAGDIPVQLKLPTGAIDATPSPPTVALTMQFYKDAPYMLDAHVAPLIAGVVVTDAAWSRLSQEDRTRMLAIAKDTEKKLFSQAAGLDASHIKAMQSAGLQVVTLDAAATKVFRTAADKLTTSMRGSMVPPEIYDLAVRERDAYRKSQSGR
jgi:TRAP-type transport system periplasmic protein